LPVYQRVSLKSLKLLLTADVTMYLPSSFHFLNTEFSFHRRRFSILIAAFIPSDSGGLTLL